MFIVNHEHNEVFNIKEYVSLKLVSSLVQSSDNIHFQKKKNSI